MNDTPAKKKNKKKTKQRQKGTNIINIIDIIIKRITIQYCNLIYPRSSFLANFGNFAGHFLRS